MSLEEKFFRLNLDFSVCGLGSVFSTVFVGERLEALQMLGIALALFGIILLFQKSVR